MKRMMNTAIVYFVVAMVSGVFFREFTKLNDFTGITTLSTLHVHLLVLGTLLFLLIAIANKVIAIEQDKLYRKFFISYNVFLPLMVLMLSIRGVLQVQGTVLSSAMNAAISGIAGLSHIGMMVSILMLLFAFKRKLIA